MRKNDTDIKNEEIKQSIFRLAHFNPSARDDYGNQVIDYLVLDSLSIFGPSLSVSASQIKDNIKNVFHLDFEEAEINAAGKRLGNKKFINYHGVKPDKEEKDVEKSRFQILSETKEKIDENLSYVKELEEEVFRKWKEEIYSKYKENQIIVNNIDLIEKSLRLFISKMFIRHGIECVALLYPEKQRTQQWLINISSNILEDFPKIDPLTDAVMKLEILLFFKSTDIKRIQYITNLFNGSFFWHMVQVDEKCSRLLRKVTRGQKLFLDNNILYSLVGFHGGNLMKSVHNILKMAKKLGYELLVTTKTIEEFKESLKRRIDEIKPIPKELVRIAIEKLDEDNFMVCYWKEFVKNGVSIKEFFAEKSHLEDILGGLEIREYSKFRRDIEDSDELKREESMLRQVAPFDTDEHVIEHDSFHRILINKLRREETYIFSKAKAWFLTHDTKLPVYDRVARRGRQFLPFCLLTNQWVQINRPLLTRTPDEKEYEESYHALVTQPFLRAMLSSFPREKAYNEVLGRLARYKNMNPELALRIVTDTHFMSTIASESDEDKIEEKIENRFVDLSAQLEKEKGKLLENVKQKEEEKKTLEERVSRIEGKIKEAENKHQRQIEKLRTLLENEKEKRESAESELDALKKQVRKERLQRSAKLRLGMTIFIFMLLEAFFVFVSVKWGRGENFWQKITSFHYLIWAVAPTLSLIAGWFIIGKKKLISLGWPWTKIFKIKYDENNKE